MTTEAPTATAPGQEWINNGNFMSLGSERGPNVGLQEAGATFTIPQEPVRCRIHGTETFQPAARRRVLLPAVAIGAEMARGPPPALKGE